MARKILLADDSVTAQNMGRKILADAGYEVITVNNGSAALKKIAEHKPELIILDVYMPGYSGLEVCQRLKEAQETSRIPVLLTVGKLEPFKPEEAKRVGAEGFIVKPFEASELLSTLSKLEDKIVPRAETSRSGRFARAIATIEEPSVQNETGADGGWKSRISFPGKKKEGPQEITDDSALYNQVNRDLRTVVQREPDKQIAPVAEAGQDQAKTKSKTSKPGDEPGDTVAVAAASVPKDITTEEIAALAAAAAQVQAKLAESGTAPSEAKLQDTPTVDKAAFPDESSTVIQETKAGETPGTPENPPAGISASQADGMTPIARLEREHEGEREHSLIANAGNGAGHSSEEREDLPVTMAAPEIAQDAAGSRWTAVSVGIDPHEAAISLEHEMQRAFSAFAAAAATHAGPATSLAETPASEFSARPAAATESLQVVASVDESKLEQGLPAVVSAESVGAAVAEQSPALGQDGGERPEQPEPFTPVQECAQEQRSNPDIEGVVSEIAPAPGEYLDTVSAEAVAEKKEGSGKEDRPVIAVASQVTPGDVAYADESAAQHSTAVTEGLVASVEQATEGFQDVAQPDLAPDNSAPTDVAPEPVSSNQVSPNQVSPHRESDLTATTAAAWANWRQIRDSGPGAKIQNERADANTADLEHVQESVPALATAALAVAAGAESRPQDAPASGQAAASAVDPHSVASIVDSLLAELRPKIVEEISRKLAAEKK